MASIAPTDGPYIVYQGKKWLDFSSCDFLGLAQHPEVKKAAIKYTLKYGVGIPTAPLASAPQEQLQAKLAQFLGTEAALLFPSLHELLQTLQQHKVTIVSSETHDIEQPRGKKSTSLFCIDDSLMIGIAGEHSFGVAAHQTGYDLVLGSLAFGVGCSGAYLAGSKKFLETLTASAPLSYPVIGALDSAFSFIPEMDLERRSVEKHRAWLHKQLKDFPFKVLKSPRVILEFKTAKEAESVRAFFAEEQIFLAPPSENTLYIAMTALHTPDDLDQLATALKKFSATDLALTIQSLTPIPSK